MFRERKSVEEEDAHQKDFDQNRFEKPLIVGIEDMTES